MPRSPADIDPAQLSLFEPAPAPAPPRAAHDAAMASPDRPHGAQPEAAPVVAQKPAFAHPRAHRDLLLDGHRVAYEFRRARRRSIGFIVGPEGLTVSAPKWVGVGEVESALREKARWILRKLQEQQERGRRLHDGRASHPETGAGAQNRQRFIFAGIPGRFPVNRPVLPA